MKSVTLAFILLAFTTATSDVLAAAADDAELGRYWTGLYTAHRGMDEGEYELSVESLTRDGNVITTRSRGEYVNNGQVYKVNMEWVINLDTLFVEMWDVPDNSGENYDAAGAYQGSISRDLSRIFVIWRNVETNAAGTLKLQAIESLPDAGE